MLKKIQNYLCIISELFFPLALIIILAQYNYIFEIGRSGRKNLFVDYSAIFLILSFLYFMIIDAFKKYRIVIYDEWLKKIKLIFYLIIFFQCISTARGILIRQVERAPLAYLIITVFFVFYIALKIAYRTFKTLTHIKFFFIIIFLYLTGYCIYCLSSIWIFNNRFLYTPFIKGFGYQSEAAAIFFVPLFFFAFGFFIEQYWRKKILLIIPLILLAFCSISSYSRPALIILHYYLAFLIILRVRGWRNIITGILIWIAVLFFITQIQGVKNYIEKTFEGQNPIKILFLYDSESYINVNDDIFRKIEKTENVLNYWNEYPIFGLGVTGVGFIDSQWVKLLGEIGIIGLLVYFIFFIYLFRLTAKVKRKCKDDFLRGIIAGYRCYIGSIIFLAIFMNVFFSSIYLIVFGILTAIILRVNYLINAEAK